MSREEDLIRSTTRAIASTVHEVPPLRLEAAADELRSPERAPRRASGGGSRPRHWRSWLAPLTAAAVVTALALALVLIRDIPNGGAVPPNPATSTGPGGVPRYYAALQPPAGKPNATFSRVLVVGDSLTGKTLATIPPPAGVETFVSVTAAADDRTFIVSALARSSSAGIWFALHLAPGTANPVRLISLPVEPQPVPVNLGLTAVITGVATAFPAALSRSGQELAVTEVTGGGEMAVKVFSVATGQLLHDWSTNDPSLVSKGDGPKVTAPPTLTWIDGDRALALTMIGPTTRSGTINTNQVTVRRLNATGPASGDLVKDSTVIWDVRTGGHGTPEASCGGLFDWPPLIGADGTTFTCTSTFAFLTFPITAGTTAAGLGRTDYQVTPSGDSVFTGAVLWTSASGDTVIGEWGASRKTNMTVGDGLHIGVISHGRFTPLRFPSGFSPVTAQSIAW
jgi:hypothetical protein